MSSDKIGIICVNNVLCPRLPDKEVIYYLYYDPLPTIFVYSEQINGNINIRNGHNFQAYC